MRHASPSRFGGGLCEDPEIMVAASPRPMFAALEHLCYVNFTCYPKLVAGWKVEPSALSTLPRCKFQIPHQTTHPQEKQQRVWGFVVHHVSGHKCKSQGRPL